MASYTIGNYSDNKSFWEQAYPAILAIENFQGGDRSPYYHTSNDKLSTLDLDYLTTFVKASVGALMHMGGCLLTGALGGGVTAGHDGSAIAGASIAMIGPHDLTYSAGTDGSGRYDRILPVASYNITASAYGYLPSTATGIALPTGGATQDIALQTAPPVAPQVSGSVLDADTVHLTWTHVPPDMTYTVHRDSEPYFAPTPDNQQRSMELPFPEPIIYDDLIGSGNRFYIVVGRNAAGAGAPDGRVGIFNFDLR